MRLYSCTYNMSQLRKQWIVCILKIEKDIEGSMVWNCKEWDVVR